MAFNLTRQEFPQGHPLRECALVSRKVAAGLSGQSIPTIDRNSKIGYFPPSERTGPNSIAFRVDVLLEFFSDPEAWIIKNLAEMGRPPLPSPKPRVINKMLARAKIAREAADSNGHA